MSEDREMFQFETREPIYKKPAFYVLLATSVIAAALFIFLRKDLGGSMSADEVRRSIQVVSQSSRWMDKKGRPDEATIVPAVTLKIKNVGTAPLKYVTLISVFVFEDTGENLSEGSVMTCQQPLAPGQESGEYVIKGFYGYSATSKEAFIRNQQNWRRIKAKLYANTKNSGPVLLGVFPISQEIEGVRVVSESGAPLR